MSYYLHDRDRNLNAKFTKPGKRVVDKIPQGLYFFVFYFLYWFCENRAWSDFGIKFTNKNLSKLLNLDVNMKKIDFME